MNASSSLLLSSISSSSSSSSLVVESRSKRFEDDGTRLVESEAEKRFLLWLNHNGAKLDKVLWPWRDPFTGIRGVVATEDIESNDVMFHIPEKLIISPPLAKKVIAESLGMKDVSKLDRFFEEADDNSLIVFLILEKLKGATSFWFPYFEILPEPSCLAEWSEDDLSELQDLEISAHAAERKLAVEQDYEKMITCLQKIAGTNDNRFSRERFSLDLFKWAVMTIQARAFGRRLPWTALVPFADCLNHRNVQTKYDYNKGGNHHFRLYPTSGTRFPKGTEAFNSYGKRSNSMLLMEYGFALENNIWDIIELELTVDENEKPLGKQKHEAYYSLDSILGPWKDEEARSRAIHSSRGGAGGGPCKLTQFCPSSIFLRYFRITCSSKDELEDFRNKQHPIEYFSQIVSYRNELESHKMIAATLKHALDHHPTSEEEDAQLLLKATGRQLSAIRYRIGRKRVLRLHEEFARQMIEALKQPDIINMSSIELSREYPKLFMNISEKVFNQ